jgi:hypothetical protein
MVNLSGPSHTPGGMALHVQEQVWPGQIQNLDVHVHVKKKGYQVSDCAITLS